MAIEFVRNAPHRIDLRTPPPCQGVSWKKSYGRPESIGDWETQNSNIWITEHVNYYFTVLLDQAIGNPAPSQLKCSLNYTIHVQTEVRGS